MADTNNTNLLHTNLDALTETEWHNVLFIPIDLIQWRSTSHRIKIFKAYQQLEAVLKE